MHAQISRKTGYATDVRLEHLENGISELVSIVIRQENVVTKILQIFFDLKYFLHFTHTHTHTHTQISLKNRETV
jgi:hypothetical protein